MERWPSDPIAHLLKEYDAAGHDTEEGKKIKQQIEDTKQLNDEWEAKMRTMEADMDKLKQNTKKAASPKDHTKEQTTKINVLKEIADEKVSAIVGDWEEVELAVDSGATETVIGESMISSIETKPGEASRRGAKYEVADGTIIKNQ